MESASTNGTVRTVQEQLQQALQDTENVRLDHPTLTVEEMMELMEVAQHDLADLPPMVEEEDFSDLDHDQNVSIPEAESEFNDLFTYSNYSGTSQDELNAVPGTRPSPGNATLQHQVPEEITYLLQPAPRYFSRIVDIDSLERSASQPPYASPTLGLTTLPHNPTTHKPMVQTVYNRKGHIDYRIKQVLKKDRRKHLVAYETNYTTGRRARRWIPESEAYKIPPDVMYEYHSNKLTWTKEEIDQSGRPPRNPRDFEAEEIED